ncbi:MAG: D-alanyl-D-alanine carboxypeptidase [Armatimonadetes bacterium]|nr:MAG: D-alanyl-D-alanine carboxypeptidase [Armatimonadota bacterium]
MRPVFYTVAVLVVAVNILLALPQAVNLVQTGISSNNVFAVNIPDTTLNTVLGASKQNYPPVDQKQAPPPLSAAAAAVYDLSSQSLIYIKDPDKRVPIASTTKLMTALIGVEYFQGSDILTVPDISYISGSNMGLVAGEKLTFRSLLYGMMLNSGNDAAFTIALNFPGGYQNFINTMNSKVATLGLVNTRFDNPAGFDSPNHFSSASDMVKIAKKVAENQQLATVVQTKETTVASTDQSLIHELKNLNKLLDLPGVLGMKTGFTPAAKENLVTLVEKEGHRVLIVVLGSDDRFGESEKLINWTYSNFIWQQD